MIRTTSRRSVYIHFWGLSWAWIRVRNEAL